MAVDLTTLANDSAERGLEILRKVVPEGRLPSSGHVAKFMRANGVPLVIQAINTTAERIREAERGHRTPVENPWDYVRAIVNGQPARATYLYLLIHLWELALRSRIELVMNAVNGPDWFRDPADYLSKPNALHLFEHHEFRARLFVEKVDAPYGKVVAPGIVFADGLIQELYLPTLQNIVLDNWGIFGTHLATYFGTKAKAAATVHRIHEARTAVMHAREIQNVFFRRSVDALRAGLEALEFDVDKTLNAINERNPQAEDLDLFVEGTPAKESSTAPLSPGKS